MFGTYQSSHIRIEIAASAEQIAGSLTDPEQLRKWLWPQQIKLSEVAKEPSTDSTALNRLSVGQEFESMLGLLKVSHYVEMRSPNGIRFVLSGGIDGFHEWQWGDGWVQSRLEGVSLVPLNLGQTLSLVRLRAYLLKD